MPKKKRSLKEMSSESDCDTNTSSEPPRKKQRVTRAGSKKSKNPWTKSTADSEEKSQFTWEVTETATIAVVSPGAAHIRGCSKIAAFDMDWTLIQPDGTHKFSKSRTDWRWLYSCVPAKLQSLHSAGYQIVIFTNQNGIGTKKISLSSVTGKIADLAEELGLPLIGLLSTQKDHWRKPCVAMWTHFAREFNNDVDISLDESFYVGDAAGRIKAWNGDKKTKKDFSCSDRKFAANVGVAFHTPEAFFLGEDECPRDKWEWRGLNAIEFVRDFEVKGKMAISGKENSGTSKGSGTNDVEDGTSIEYWYHGELPIARSDTEMVIMRGPPASGKSSFAKKWLVSKGYAWINRDTLRTKKKCHDAARKALKGGQSVVVDNTNPDRAARAPYLEIAGKCGVKVRLLMMKTERAVAEHMNLVREKATQGRTKRISSVVYNVYYKKEREDTPPSKDEGFAEVVEIDFVPRFADEQEKALWCQFT